MREVTGFYRNYDSMRYVGDTLVMRMRRAPDGEQLAMLNDRFGHLCSTGRIHVAEPYEPERKENDRLGLERIAFTFAKHGYGHLRELIDTVNGFVD